MSDWKNRAMKYQLDLHQRARELTYPGREDPDKSLIMVSLALILENLIEQEKRPSQAAQ